MPALHGWHRGERAIQHKLNYDGVMSTAYTWISGDLPEEHREFHTTRLPFLPVTTLDHLGRPWGSILAGRDGKPGFIWSPNDTALFIEARIWEGDPFIRNAQLFEGNDELLIAGIGIEFSTRRRNKFAGRISGLSRTEDTFRLQLTVNQAIGNCPKYINVRDLLPHTTCPKVLTDKPYLAPSETLPKSIRTFILESDTVFIGTVYAAHGDESELFPSHVGMNQRGGRQGFIRLSGDGTIVIPDFSGNRLLTSLGNIEATPLASLTFVNFVSGDILYLTGVARNFVGPDAQRIMPRQKVLTTVHTTGYTLVENALPVRQSPSSPVIRSPYSPPVLFLAEEASAATVFDENIFAKLSKIEIHRSNLATFTWQLSEDVLVKPGQAAVMDFTSFLGSVSYQHMAPRNPVSVNDDRIRTWTIFSSHLSASSTVPTGTREIAITMREKPGGAVTGTLFAVVRKLTQLRPELLTDTRPLDLAVRLVGISGDFVLPSFSLQESKIAASSHSLLWFAGGIGVTPFLSMLSGLSRSYTDTCWDITLILSTREPDVLLPLIATALQGDAIGKRHKLVLEIFSTEPIPDIKLVGACRWEVSLARHVGRLDGAFIGSLEGRLNNVNLKVYVCGPETFENDVIAGLAGTGYDRGKVRREGFGY